MASIVDSAKYEIIADYARAFEEVWTGVVDYAGGSVATFPVVPQVSEDSVPAYPMLPEGLAGATGLPKNGLVKATTYSVKGRPFGARHLADYETLWGATITPESGSTATYVVDFHGLRAIGDVAVADATVSKLRAWQGVQFEKDGLSGPLPATLNLLTQKIEITLASAMSIADFRAKAVITCLSYPSNVRFVIMAGAAGPAPAAGKKLAVIPFAQATGKEPILWTYNGDLAGQVALPDFSQAVNDFLEASQALDGECHPQLVAYSDTPGFLEIDLQAKPGVHVHYLSAVQFGGADPLATTVALRHHDDRQTVPLTLFKSDEAVPAGLDAKALSLRIAQVTFELSGQMDEDRPDGAPAWPADVAATASAQVSTVFSLAQPIQPASGWPITGVDLHVLAANGASLIAELQADQAGTPSGKALATADVDLSQLPAGGGWVTVRFRQPLPVQAQQALWIVLKARAGSATWRATIAPIGGTGPAMLFSRDGLFWRSHEPKLIGWQKVMVLPPPGERPAPLRARLTGDSLFDLRPAAEPRSLVLALGGDDDVVAESTLTLQLVPATKGQVTLGSVVVEYAAEPVPAEGAAAKAAQAPGAEAQGAQRVQAAVQQQAQKAMLPQAQRAGVVI